MNTTISICEDWIVTSLYEKKINLYLYIPPHSTHAPGVLIRLVSGNILCIHLLCRDKEEFNRRMKELYVGFLVRGYEFDFLIPAFTRGITGARSFIKRSSTLRYTSDQDKDIKGRVFFNMTYYPRDPTSKYLQHKWRQHLLHPPWDPTLWRFKKKHKFPIGIN